MLRAVENQRQAQAIKPATHNCLIQHRKD